MRTPLHHLCRRTHTRLSAQNECGCVNLNHSKNRISSLLAVCLIAFLSADSCFIPPPLSLGECTAIPGFRVVLPIYNDWLFSFCFFSFYLPFARIWRLSSYMPVDYQLADILCRCNLCLKEISMCILAHPHCMYSSHFIPFPQPLRKKRQHPLKKTITYRAERLLMQEMSYIFNLKMGVFRLKIAISSLKMYIFRLKIQLKA